MRPPRLALGLALSLCAGAACTRLDIGERPRGVETISVVAGVNRATVTWAPVAGVVDYRVYAGSDPSLSAVQIDTTATIAVVTGLAPGTTTYVGVGIRDGERFTEPEVVVRVEPLAPASFTPSTVTLGSNLGAPTLGFAVAAHDFDGDGRAEIAATCPSCDDDFAQEGRLFLFEAPDATTFGQARMATNDLDGTTSALGVSLAPFARWSDGTASLAVGAPLHSIPSSDTGAAVVYEGGALGISTSGAIVYGRDDSSSGYAIAAGDFDGDGDDDLAVGEPAGNGAVQFLVTNGAAFEDGGRMEGSLLQLDGDASLGLSLAAGDINGDGFDDLVVGAPLADVESRGAVYVVPGSATGLLPTGTPALVGTIDDRQLGSGVAVPGDLDGDGREEWAVAAGSLTVPLEFALYRGTADFSPDPIWTWTGSAEAAANVVVGFSFAGGDYDGDGFRDLAVGEPGFDGPGAGTEEGRVLLFAGAPGGPDPAPTAFFAGSAAGEWAGQSLSFGDVDDDGFDELVVGATGQGVSSLRMFRGQRREGPRVLAGSLVHVRLGDPAGLSGASFSDPLPGTPHTCTITWGDGESTTIDPCVPDDIDDHGNEWFRTGVFTVVLRVESTDGRSGEAATRVYVE